MKTIFTTYKILPVAYIRTTSHIVQRRDSHTKYHTIAITALMMIIFIHSTVAFAANTATTRKNADGFAWFATRAPKVFNDAGFTNDGTWAPSVESTNECDEFGCSSTWAHSDGHKMFMTLLPVAVGQFSGEAQFLAAGGSAPTWAYRAAIHCHIQDPAAPPSSDDFDLVSPAVERAMRGALHDLVTPGEPPVVEFSARAIVGAAFSERGAQVEENFNMIHPLMPVPGFGEWGGHGRTHEKKVVRTYTDLSTRGIADPLLFATQTDLRMHIVFDILNDGVPGMEAAIMRSESNMKFGTRLVTRIE